LQAVSVFLQKGRCHMAKAKKRFLSMKEMMYFHFLAIATAGESTLKAGALLKAYHGGKETSREVGNVTGELFAPAIMLRHLESFGTVSSAEANDGTIIRLFDGFGKESFRVFFSKRGKWAGRYGVSGAVKSAMENALPDCSFDWEQQGTKNYFFSGNNEALLRFAP